MKSTILFALVLFCGLLARPATSDARFLFPVFKLDCSTASTGGGTGPWAWGCQCVQGGWIIGGVIVADDIIGCHLGMAGNDACNMHWQCSYMFGGKGWDVAQRIPDQGSDRQ